MNKICEQCVYPEGCDTPNYLLHCELFQNKLRLDELNLAKDYLNSDYYWKRYRKLLGEEEYEQR